MFAALTTPALLRRWYSDLVSADLDLRPGGHWRLVTCRPDGREIGQHDTFREMNGESVAHYDRLEALLADLG